MQGPKRKQGSFEAVLKAHKDLLSPSKNFKSIHITGTNGKGTVALNIAKGLSREGYKTALFTSPHLEHVTERISIDGKAISFERMQKIYAENLSILEKFSFFDLLTLIAFIYFSEEGVDRAVIEVGIGGKKDPTNVIDPIISIITNISLDHASFLGNTLESVAENKAKIIKKNTPVVLGYHARHLAVLEYAKKMDAKVIECDFYDDFCLENKALVDLALKELGAEPLDTLLLPPARFEVHGNMIFDMAHNPSAFLSLKKKIQKQHPNKKVIAIFNISADKEVKKCLEILKSFTQEIYFYPFHNERLLTMEDAKNLGLQSYQGESSEIILVCGSIYFMKELLP